MWGPWERMMSQTMDYYKHHSCEVKGVNGIWLHVEGQRADMSLYEVTDRFLGCFFGRRPSGGGDRVFVDLLASSLCPFVAHFFEGQHSFYLSFV